MREEQIVTETGVRGECGGEGGGRSGTWKERGRECETWLHAFACSHATCNMHARMHTWKVVWKFVGWCDPGAVCESELG